MELSWSTFILEIINFLVLVWILKRFLYRPVLEVIEKRRAGIEKTLTDAETLHSDAEKLQQQYQGRLADWEHERQQFRDSLAQELDAERARKLEALQAELEQERAKAGVANERRLADSLRKYEETALRQGALFATRLLEQAAGPETEHRLVELMINELEQLPEEQVKQLRNHYGKSFDDVVVLSAYPVNEQQQQRLTRAIERIIGTENPPRFEQDKQLLAGVRITIGAWLLGANLRDELREFAELAHGD